jgi:glycosyltransferase involved in cell wall biosynthesis
MSDTAGHSPLTVAILFHGYLHIGGVETHLLSLLRHMNPTPQHGRPRWLILSAASQEFAAQAAALGGLVLPWTPLRAWDYGALGRLRHILLKYDVDLIHSHSPLAAWHGGLAGKWLRRPALVTVHLPLYAYVHGYHPGARAKRRAYQWVETIIERFLADRLIFVSAQVCREARAFGGAPARTSTVISNGIDLLAMQPAQTREALRRSLGVPMDDVVLCSACRLAHQKGVDVLLAAVARLAAQPSWHLWLLGDGPARAALEQQTQRLGLEARVSFLGFRYNVADYLNAADIFVLASRAEASPLALMEAMAAAKPCVVTAVGENALLLAGNQNGLLVPPEDEAALAGGLTQLLADASLRARLGRAARAAAAGFDDRRMAAETDVVYRSLLTR